MLFVLGSNPLRRIRSYPLVLEAPLAEARRGRDARLAHDVHHLQSDYVLPAAAWYERDEHKWATPLMPFIHSGEKATSYYEAKSDWEIISRLTEAIDSARRSAGSRASSTAAATSARSTTSTRSSRAAASTGTPTTTRSAPALIDNASNLGDLTWPELKKKGFAPLREDRQGHRAIGNATEIEPGETITPLTKHVFDKMPYPTLSRRIQFYIDQELYLEMGERAPVHKDPPQRPAATTR